MDWRAFDRLYPIGRDRHDAYLAQIAAVIANVNRGKDRDPFKLADFIFEYDRVVPEAQTAEQIESALKAWVVATKALPKPKAKRQKKATRKTAHTE